MANLKANNDMAVSPIVATLVLIVVAVIGAVAVGTIMGAFSSDVSKKANSGDASSASQTEILIAGSTTVDPVTQALGKLYTAKNPGIKITSQGTGSGAGFQAVTAGIADLGAMSEAPDAAKMAQNPAAQKWRIGSGIVALIQNKSDTTMTTVAPADIKTLYSTSSGTGTLGGITTVTPITRSDSSGTADTFAKWIGFAGQSSISKSVKAVSGNAAVVSTVASTAGGFGYADYGYAVRSDSGVKLVDYSDDITTGGYLANSAGAFTYANLTNTVQYQWRSTEEQNADGSYVKDGKQYDSTVAAGKPGSDKNAMYYNLSLVHPLYYISNGNPTTLEMAFISFARSNDGVPAFKSTNTWGQTQLL